MTTQDLNINSQKYINPYFGGVLLGLLVLLTVFITGRGLGASGAVKSTVVTTTNIIAPAHTTNNAYSSQFVSEDHSPMNTWLVYESLGLILGAFLSGIFFGRVKKFRIDKGPKITNKTRLIAALIGGALFGFGSQFGRGCTSGAALSGSATFSLGGVIILVAIFGSAYAFAWFARKLWI